ncbi:unnamed protein product [Trifolium pratense]|uniref:Uncharacterized protein n=1 Tax=Trifolium pratense TaxID=57577 RepID=A0ACB0L556_TRIPR|nr:unnamed protein product [Trifolium pratense]
MAYRRCLLQRGNNLIDRRCHPSFTYILHSDETKRDRSDENKSSSSQGISNNTFIKSSSFRSSLNGSTAFSPFAGYNFCRNMSTLNRDDSDNISVMSDVADVLTDTAMDAGILTETVVDAAVSSQAPVVSEVVIAAADNYAPVQVLQYAIDAVHSFTGLNWWAAIVLTTVLIRTATVPLLINQLKATSKLTLMRPHLEAIKEEMDGKTFDPEAVAEGQKRMKRLFKEYGVSPFTPMKGLFIQGPVFISFFLAISNMAEKMPSFKHGGAFWFTDLSTPDALYIFPVLTALSFLIVVECNVQEGMEGNPMGDTMKKFSRILAFVSVPLTMGFPKAIFCYWITSNLFSLAYGTVLKVPGMKKTLGIPEIPAAPTSSPQSPFSIFPALKQPASAADSQSSSPVELPVESPKRPNKKTSSSAIISQRLRTLEKQVKGRKKNKKID